MPGIVRDRAADAGALGLLQLGGRAVAQRTDYLRFGAQLDLRVRQMRIAAHLAVDGDLLRARLQVAVDALPGPLFNRRAARAVHRPIQGRYETATKPHFSEVRAIPALSTL